ncbi:MAG TPA: sigma-70 family RNA polymerase sigma factor [Candidatus Dormibacteraeota bacterium]|nr:sigma-70 family RNA polymerase sigma factor [Candidatus Dormibacteraeota bacterium]
MDDAHPQPWALLLRHRDVALAVLLRRTASLTEAEDCVQEAMVRLGRGADLDTGRARTLLLRTALRVAAEHRRASARERAAVVLLAGSAAAEVVSPEELAARRAEVVRALAAVEQLPRRERQVLLLQLAGFSVAEVAGRVGISYKSVEGALTRARARVRLILGGLAVWVADRMRRAGSSRGEAAATTVAALLLLLPSPHLGLDRHPQPQDMATPPPQLATVPADPAGVAASAPAKAPRRDGMSTPDRPAPVPALALPGHFHYDPTIVDTGTLGIPGIVQWGVRVHGSPPDPTKLDAMSVVERCLHPNTDPNAASPC